MARHPQGIDRGGGGVLLEILGGGEPPGSPNPDPISDFPHPFSDQTSNSIAVFRNFWMKLLERLFALFQTSPILFYFI